VLAYATALAGGIACALAWLVTETVAGALLAWISAGLLVVTFRRRRAYRAAYCCGLVVHAVAFYWVFGTVARFGGLGPVVASVAFALFVITGALQFLLFAWIHHNLGPRLDTFALRAPISAVLSEFLMIRIFHWHYGHTQVAFPRFAQIAGIGGALLLTFIMFWNAEAAVRLVAFRERRRAFLLPAVALLISLAYGQLMMHTFSSASGQTQALEVVLVQGDPDLAMRLDADAAWENLARVFELSRRAARPHSLIVWPESSIPSYIPADLGSARRDRSLPWLGDGSAFLVGGYSFRSETERFNTAFAVYPDGTVPAPYFKQILIPFGEYMPGSSVFQWLNRLNPNASVLTAGSEATVFAYPMRRPDGAEYMLKVAPLICYEDTVSDLARTATLRGAELLVNLTYDNWFGRSAAPFQHHQIATFRAIENRRYIVRATSTGYTAVVDPLGQTIAHLPPFAEGRMNVRVVPQTYQSTYTAYVGDLPWWGLTAVALALVVHRRWPWR
jgi:apolipoprotein N-acyltransferase